MGKKRTKWLKDDLDRRIVRELQRNSREATANIAARLGVPRSTVNGRIDRMEQDGIIAGYSVILSRNPSEEQIQCLTLLEIRQQDTKAVLHELEKYNEIRVCLSINGEYDFFVSIESPSIKELDGIIDEIGRIPGVLRTNTSVVFGRRFDRRYKEVAQRISEQMANFDGIESESNSMDADSQQD